MRCISGMCEFLFYHFREGAYSDKVFSVHTHLVLVSRLEVVTYFGKIQFCFWLLTVMYQNILLWNCTFIFISNLARKGSHEILSVSVTSRLLLTKKNIKVLVQTNKASLISNKISVNQLTYDFPVLPANEYMNK